jgi:hypothetical protein
MTHSLLLQTRAPPHSIMPVLALYYRYNCSRRIYLTSAVILHSTYMYILSL